MPTRKQRRRRRKLQRHEYEYVLETEEGEEVPLEKPRERERRDGGRGGDRGAARGGRAIPEPSLRRVLKRTAILMPLAAAFIYLAPPRETALQLAVSTAWVTLIFIPFSYAVDTLMYRMMRRRLERRGG